MSTTALALHPFARSLGISSGGRLLTYDRLLDLCVVAYWQRRQVVGVLCGSEPGYRQHLTRRTPTFEKDERADEPVDLALEPTDDGPTLRVLGRDLDVRFTEHDDAGSYPHYNELLDKVLHRLELDGPGRFPRVLNPTLLARTVPLQRAGRSTSTFTFTCSDASDHLPPVVVRPADHEDDVVVAIMPMRLLDDPGASA